MAEEEQKKEIEETETPAAEPAEELQANDAEATEPAETGTAAAKGAGGKSARKKKAAGKSKAKTSGSAASSVKALADSDFKLSPEVFGTEPKVGVLHEVVRAEMAAARQGSASTKTRGMVRGGGSKPWRQKGTGRARAGSSRMPHWTGGGIAFGPTPRSYKFKVNRKVRSKALKMALSARAREGELRVVESLAFKEPRTAEAAAALGSLDVSYPLLVLLDESDTNAELSFRNLPEVGVSSTGELNVSDILWARTLLVSKPALETLNKLER